MSVWRRKAIESFPELTKTIEDPQEGIYLLFSELERLTLEAYRSGQDDVLAKAFGFAEWCVLHGSEDLRNAACVSFYEHVLDGPEDFDRGKRFITPAVLSTCPVFWDWFLTPRQQTSLRNKSARPKTNRRD